MYRSQSQNSPPQPVKLKRKRNLSDDSEAGSRRYEEIRRLVDSGQYHITSIDLGRRMLAYYSHHDS